MLQGEGEYTLYQWMQYCIVCLLSSATGRGSTWNEYLYYSTTSSETPYNPLYRMDIASRTTHGECSSGEGGRGEGERGSGEGEGGVVMGRGGVVMGGGSGDGEGGVVMGRGGEGKGRVEGEKGGRRRVTDCSLLYSD